MARPKLRVAFEGCGHGTLNAIYASIKKTCEVKGWDGVDLLIIGGDFQAVRNTYDLNATVIPPKYREMGDFHEYYSGKRKAPYLTLFIGGNHEASNHLFELYYGGWVAPNIYYLGAANVLRFGPLRIVGLSGIWKGYSYKKPHFERPPYSQDDLRSAYHVREFDTRKLLQVRSQVDLGLSHDWPRGVEWQGNWKRLFRHKAHLEPDARDGVLGNVAAKMVMDRLRPYYWFSAHYHCKFSAVINHEPSGKVEEHEQQPHETTSSEKPANPDEIDIDLSGDEAEDSKAASLPDKSETGESHSVPAVPANLREQLPASFQKPKKVLSAQEAPLPPEITNLQTCFLALDKCLPRRDFLQILEMDVSNKNDCEPPYKLAYDKEWLAITRVFAPDLIVGDVSAQVPADKGYAFYQARIEEETRWVEANLVQQDRMAIPKNFEITAPIYDPSVKLRPHDQDREYASPQTSAFCEMLNIPNPFYLTEEEALNRLDRGPTESGSNGTIRRGGFSRGRGHGRGFRGGRGVRDRGRS